MRGDYEPRISVEHITDAEITAVIRYLDPERNGATRSSEGDAVFATCFILIATIAGILAYIWLYFRAQ
jgi:hypothetical protein